MASATTSMPNNRLFCLTEVKGIQQMQSVSHDTEWTADIIPKLEALSNMAAVELPLGSM